MSVPIDPTLRGLNDCGCCEGTHTETPREVKNRPGLSAVAYRVGTHSQFKASMLAGLSDSSRPALAGLQTRDDADFTIALLDAWACVADVLTFYQERIANESYLRTATERWSVLQLAREIGYELAPGLAARAELAFTLDDAPGAATLEKGLRVQSVPGPNEKPQTFETVERIDARAEWNAMTPRTSQLFRLDKNSTEAYVKGVAADLRIGDALLFVSDDREADPKKGKWSFRAITAVGPDAENGRTRVAWSQAVGDLSSASGGLPRVYALRLRASVFGHNAPEWRSMLSDWRINYMGAAVTNPLPDDWPNFFIFTPLVIPGSGGGAKASEAREAAGEGLAAEARQRVTQGQAPKPPTPPKVEPIKDTIDLDTVYPQIKQGSWLVVAVQDDAELCSVEKAVEASRADFTLTGKTTRVTLGGGDLTRFEFDVRAAVVFAQSEELTLAETPITEPVYGNNVELNRRLGVDPDPGRKLIARGKRQRVSVGANAAGLTLDDDKGAVIRPLTPGESLFMLGPRAFDSASQRWSWHVLDADGVGGRVSAGEGSILYAPSRKEDGVVSELLTLLEARAGQDAEHTRLDFVAPPGATALRNVYERASFAITANVAAATHGESVAEVLGNGDASAPFQRFKLKQSPVTYVAAPPSGARSTLEVFVNDLKWHEVDTLYGRGPRDRVYVARVDDDGATTVQFGDGANGARLPTGSENVRATYRKGIGRAGLVNADQLSLLMTRPLGVRAVTNPLAASGAQDPQALAGARRNAPLTVLTLGRIVSLRDYEDFARSFAGIARASAAWTWDGRARGVLITVAGPDGDPVPESGALHDALIDSIGQAGDERVPVRVKNFRQAAFRLSARIKIDPDRVEARVLAAVADALRAAFSFDARSFGQQVTLSELFLVIQSADGVVAADVDSLHRADKPAQLNSVLEAEAPAPGADPATQGAELLLLDLDPQNDLRTMP